VAAGTVIAVIAIASASASVVFVVAGNLFLT